MMSVPPSSSSHSLLTISCSNPRPTGIRSETSRKGFSRFVGYSHTLSVTKMAKKGHGERPLGGLYPPLRRALAHRLIVLSARRKLAGIIVKLRPLSEQHGIVKFFKNVDHAQVLNGFVQDLAYAVTDYQARDADSIAGAV